MSKYYVLSVDSFQDAFTIMDSTKKFCLSVEIQNRGLVLETIKPGDFILVYKKMPVSAINILLNVTEVQSNCIVVEKKLEVSNMVVVKDSGYNFDTADLTEISREFFEKTCWLMVSDFEKDILDDRRNEADDLKKYFEKFILEVLGLKSVSQVRDLEILSDMLFKSGVISKKAYDISNVEEYRQWVKTVKSSREYQEYNAEKKEKSLSLGLASDEGMTNYERFLDYLAQNTERVTGAENVLLYGVPGVGKSYEIQENYCNDDNRMERVVFHPDYTYSDFVGQILPRVVEGQLKYEFMPGPFTKMLKKAWDNPKEKFYLVIEEINRGNAPAIFGEIFQLLDRKSGESSNFKPSEYGESEYSITNYDVSKIIYGDENHPIRIPSNLWVLATMNTADQNVFTLDTAFQRRWNMQHIKNDILSAGHAKTEIGGSKISWGAFALVVNGMIAEMNVDLASSEDKRLGAYFVKADELSENKFSEKVLKYLWDDAFKMDKELLFDVKCKTLDSVIETYQLTEDDKLKAILRMDVYQKMLGKTKQ